MQGIAFVVLFLLPAAVAQNILNVVAEPSTGVTGQVISFYASVSIGGGAPSASGVLTFLDQQSNVLATYNTTRPGGVISRTFNTVGTFHIYVQFAGDDMVRLTASAYVQIIAAGNFVPVTDFSFERPLDSVWPHYMPTYYQWTFSSSNSGGVNGDGDYTVDPFATNTYIPDGTHVAFIQAAGNQNSSMTTTLSGLTVGQTYQVIFFEGSRQSYVAFQYAVSINGQLISPVLNGRDSPYFISQQFPFQATATTAVLGFHAYFVSPDSDGAVLIDAVQISAVASLTTGVQVVTTGVQTTGAPPSCGTPVNNKDITGNVVGESPINNAADCCNLCRSIETCNAFTINASRFCIAKQIYLDSYEVSTPGSSYTRMANRPTVAFANQVCADSYIEGLHTWIGCPVGKIQSVLFASYGTVQGGCNADGSLPMRGECHSDTSTQIVTDACVGNEICSIFADNTVFGDPCPGVQKHLVAVVRCDGLPAMSTGIQSTGIMTTGIQTTGVQPSCTSVTNGFDMTGSIVGERPNRALAECCALCLAVSTCNLYTYNVQTRTCFLKNAYLDAQETANAYVSYARINLRPSHAYTNQVCADSSVEGQETIISCPTGVISEITFSSYGTAAPCTDNGPLPEYTDCHSRSSMNLVRQACLNRTECSITATNEVFGDPCIGIGKHLVVVARCYAPPVVTTGVMTTGILTTGLPPATCGRGVANIDVEGAIVQQEVVRSAAQCCTLCTSIITCNSFSFNPSTMMCTAKTVFLDSLRSIDNSLTTYPMTGREPRAFSNQVCADSNVEGVHTFLSCPDGVIKSILYASYGTYDGTCTNYGPVPTVIPPCHSTSSRRVVERECLNQTQCAIFSDNEAFGDPCVGTLKHLVVVAQCGAIPVVTTGIQSTGIQTTGIQTTGIQTTGVQTTTGPARPPSCSSITSKKDISGVIVGEQPNSNTGACCNYCLSIATCNAYTFNANNGVCMAKTVFVDSAVTDNGAMSYATINNRDKSAFTNQVCADSNIEGVKTYLSCPNGNIGQILYASYGEGSGCTSFGLPTKGPCQAPNALSVVEHACLGRNECNVSADNSLFSDPCVGTLKHLVMVAKCDPIKSSPSSTPSDTKSSNTGAVVAGVLVPIAIIVAGAIGYYVYQRRKAGGGEFSLLPVRSSSSDNESYRKAPQSSSASTSSPTVQLDEEEAEELSDPAPAAAPAKPLVEIDQPAEDSRPFF